MGGTVGLLSAGTVENNFNFGVVVGDSEVGCIVGKNNGGSGNIINNHYDKQMCGEGD